MEAKRASNVLFFQKGKQGPVWFYEIAAPDGRKNYTKTKPMRPEEFTDCAAWWGGAAREGRVETEQAWQVSFADIKESGYNLDLHNPNRPTDLEHRSPKELIAELIKTERELLWLYEELQREIEDVPRRIAGSSASESARASPANRRPRAVVVGDVAHGGAHTASLPRSAALERSRGAICGQSATRAGRPPARAGCPESPRTSCDSARTARHTARTPRAPAC